MITALHLVSQGLHINVEHRFLYLCFLQSQVKQNCMHNLLMHAVIHFRIKVKEGSVSIRSVF